MTRINTNVQSLIAQRALTINNASLNRSLERLSSGLRINSGKDDPAGLITSESLRASIRSIDTAVDNATRADTIVAVAEGGLQEVSSLLLDLENLVDQSANQAGVTAEEVAANQLQIDSILNSINRLSESTAFGDKKLLNGSLDFTTSGVNVNEPTGATLSHLGKVQVNAAKVAAGTFRQVTISRVTASTRGNISAVLGGTTATSTTVRDGTLGDTTTLQIRGEFGSQLLSFASGTSAANIATAVNALSGLTGVRASAFLGATGAGTPTLSISTTNFGTDAFVSVSVLENSGNAVGDAIGVNTSKATGTNGTFTVNGTNAIVSGLDLAVRAGDISADLTLTSAFGDGTSTETSTSFEITGGGAVFAIAPTVGLAGQESLGIGEVSTGQLGNASVGFLSTLGSGLANDLASKNFTTAQRIVRAAIKEVATLRGRLGGFQKDTLQTTISSLRVAGENIRAAESAIRDADFAEETSALTRAQILVASAGSVLQLANAQPQSALSLLG